MLRVAVTIVCTISLLLCAASVALWMRSYWTSDLLNGPAMDPEGKRTVSRSFQTWRGSIYVSVRRITGVLPPAASRRRRIPATQRATTRPTATAFGATTQPARTIRPRPFHHLPLGWSSIALQVTTDKPLYGRRQWGYFGFGRIQGTFVLNPTPAGRRTGPLSITVVPLYPIVIASSLAPLAWVTLVVRRRHRRRQGLCPACGYDLTGNTSGVCPECGKPIRSGGTDDR